MNQYIQLKAEDFQKAIDFFKKDIANLRTGRANPSILEGIQIDSYGTKSPINSLANVNVGDGQSLLIAPWDKKITKDIEKALVEANLGIGVVNEGDQIRLTIPQMTEENRLDLVKNLNEKQEKARIVIRQIREEVKEEIEKGYHEKEISEDDKFKFIKELDEKASDLNNQLKEIKDKKEKEIMTV